MTHAAIENWEYFDIIREATEPQCSQVLQESVSKIDLLLGVPFLAKRVKSLFGLSELENVDFASAITARKDKDLNLTEGLI